MLYVIHCANNRELTYRGGQEEIVHLEADLHRVVRWAEDEGVQWAFSLSNAGAFYATFLSRIEDLDQLDLGGNHGKVLPIPGNQRRQASRVPRP
jgi:hypothetical protein